MLKNVSGKDRRDGAVLLWQMQPVDDGKLYVAAVHGSAGTNDHMFGNVNRADAIEACCELLRDAAGAASDLKTAPPVNSVLFPMPPEIPPVGLPQRIEL